MVSKTSPASGNFRVIATNRKARHNFFIEETLEAGLELTGTEVKSLREGKANISEAYASEEKGELLLINAYIPEYQQGNRFNHAPRRPRRILMHRRELDRWIGLVNRGGMAIVPLKLYFNARGIAKLELGLAKGKKLHDKRQTEKKRDWAREKARLLREKG